MKTNKILVVSFSFSVIITIIAAYLKISHLEHANIFLTIGLLFLAVFIVTAIFEIASSDRIDKSEKIIWIVGFLFFATITGLIYILSARKRIITLKTEF